ncbi:MAG: ABC transporter substrate-binding protein [Elusimicrobia bacterium]|nr:ABC transporter substrate-binding protein [Elusimicrobiota bacterium]
MRSFVSIFFGATFLFLSQPLAAAPRRLVSLLPSHTEIVQALGAGEFLVGVSDVEKKGAWPGVPRVGGLEPNWEALIALKPDLVLADNSHERFENEFKRFRLQVLFLPGTGAQTMEDVFSIIQKMGALLDRTSTAEALVQTCRARVKKIESRLPSANGPSVYFEIWPRPFQACAPSSLQGHLLSRAKAKNIMPPSRNSMPLVSSEWVAEHSPEFILHTGIVSSDEIARRPGWERLPAVKNGRVIVVDPDKFSRAGPGIVQAFEELVGILYGLEVRP